MRQSPASRCAHGCAPTSRARLSMPSSLLFTLLTGVLSFVDPVEGERPAALVDERTDVRRHEVESRE
ncbi:hypothetical protein VO01_16080 (plasmid) [Clavibacter michiganensis subsp. insidiosus]|uniref:Uncharacterized protein n=1 Tax=Clavibacter michiganensis subsp. insidiosus TaxID=33014 RepID=A0A0D5CN69_9MICO|nr:hypothetical protein VO01_16080 [Clavibacter michiganensis subsp. insidiosus]AWF99950.1 hypothetical protein BEH61_15700 [Clavibacter michiganensis subsp. insidiosus]